MNSHSYEHIFYQHLLSRKHVLPQPGPPLAETWPSWFLFACLVLLIVVKLSAFQRVIKIVQSAYTATPSAQLEREESNQLKLYSISLLVFFAANLSFLLYKINLVYRFVIPSQSHLVQFLLFIFLVCLLYTIRFMANKLLVFVSGEEKLLGSYETSTSMINQASGLFLFPWLVLAEFSKFNPLLFISGALITLFAGILIKWYKGLLVCMADKQVGLLQIFSYFCGLEILPSVVLVKYVIETF